MLGVTSFFGQSSTADAKATQTSLRSS